ncbi:MAG: hypothetical protein HYZ28_05725 [Myxococcales bacterium]|nr:hypothetical protein [Myxococcales bacterium]
MRGVWPLLGLALACGSRPERAAPFELRVGEKRELSLSLAAEGEAVLSLTGSVLGASWKQAGAESLTLRVVTGTAVQRHLVWATGSEPLTHRVAVGRLAAGQHLLKLEALQALSPAAEAALAVSSAELAPHEDQLLARHAPILLGRDDAAVNDLPLLLYGGRAAERTLRYSVVYSNEDGGTGVEPRLLLARWGRLTDIEWVVEVDLDDSGAALATRFQGLGHGSFDFFGPREGEHPILRVATKNGTFADDAKPSRFKLAPAVVSFDESKEPRERVMDLHPWLHRLADEEGEREGKLDPSCADAQKAWATRCLLLVDVDISTQPSSLEGRRVWGLEVETPSGRVRSEMDLGAEARLDRSGQVRVAVPVGPSGELSAVRLYAAPDGSGPFQVSASGLRAFRVVDYSPELALSRPEAKATLTEAGGTAALFP